jgi:glucose-6-phosphate isomerase
MVSMKTPWTLDLKHLESQFSQVQLHTLFKKRELAKKNIITHKQDIGFLNLPSQDVSKIKQLAKLTQKYCTTLLVIGIGGSSLGAKAALQALGQNSETRVIFLENPNPDRLYEVLQNIDLKKTAINVISKSGKTLETLSLFFVLYDKLKKILREKQFKQRVIITTEKSSNFLYRLGKKEGFATLVIPKNVGGRFSVLSPVGLFPMAVSNISISQMLEGAQTVNQNRKNTFLYATLAYGAHKLLKRPITVLFPYDERLSSFGDWFNQLWAESLAKSESSGPTPLKAVGPMDQHSLLQLFLQGPRDKWFTLVTLENYISKIVVPNTKALLQEFDYLKNMPLDKLLKAELKATEKSLQEFQNPTCTLTLSKLDAFAMGGLFFHFELATAVLGYLYEINPFDQPAVEQGKLWTKAFLKS